MVSLVDLVRGEEFLRVPVRHDAETILVINKKQKGMLNIVMAYLSQFDPQSAIKQLNDKGFGTSTEITHVIYTGENPEEWVVMVGGREPYMTALGNCGFPFEGRRKQRYAIRCRNAST